MPKGLTHLLLENDRAALSVQRFLIHSFAYKNCADLSKSTSHSKAFIFLFLTYFFYVYPLKYLVIIIMGSTQWADRRATQ